MSTAKRWIICGGILVVLIIINVFYLLNIPTSRKVKAPGRQFMVQQAEAPQQLAQPKDETITLLAVGDIMLSRNVAATLKKENDLHYPFSSLQPLISRADIAFGNLESPITPGPVIQTGSFTFHADPGIEQSLAWAGFDVLSLANNHFPNYGAKGIADTRNLLDQAGIRYTGAGANIEQALTPAIREVCGKKFGFLAFNDGDVVPTAYGATKKNAGTALMNVDTLKQAVTSLRPQVDYVIVSMHSGTEYSAVPNQRQIDFAHAAIDNGADLVIGHHPHVVQSIEKYQGKYILYSLGNFIFDQMFSTETRQGLMAEISFDDQGVNDIVLLPTQIENYSQPQILDLTKAGDIQRRLKISLATTTLDNFSVWRIDK
ncbi:MAG: CapA family protein [Candidatus Komeilibacteria bacterium]